MKKPIKKLAVFSVSIFCALSFSSCDPMFYGGTVSTSMSYDSYNPAWAPDYYNGARYYYLPDIDCYYDLSSRNFVLFRNGQWAFVNDLNPYYPSFDLNTSFVVVLNSNVYRPWLYNDYYRSHYPRHYYRDYYDHSNIPYVRGFNENNRSAIYWGEHNRNNARSWDNRNMNNNYYYYSDADRRVQQQTRYDQGRQNNSWNNNGQNPYSRGRQDSQSRDQSAQNNRSNQPNNQPTPNNNQSNQPTYRRGNDNNNSDNRSSISNRDNMTTFSRRSIGQPVKVERNMRMPATTNQGSHSGRR